MPYPSSDIKTPIGVTFQTSGRHALTLLAVAALVACGGASPPDAQALVEEESQEALFADAPVDYGPGPGAGLPSDDAASGRRSALGSPVEAMGVPVPVGPADAHVKGAFGEAFTWPIIPLHTVLLPDGRVMSYGSKPSGLQGAQIHYAVWDPALGTGAESKQLLTHTTGTDIFCAGQVLLPQNGDVLLVGGDRIANGVRNYANSDVNLFTRADNKLTKQNQSMAFQRWYATVITTNTGEQAVIGGRVDRFFAGSDLYPPTDDTYASTPEMYNATTGWRTLSTATSDAAYGAVLQAWNYPRAWWSPQGNVAIINVKGEIFSLDVSGTGAVMSLAGKAPAGAYMLPAAMYQPGKILSVRTAGQAVVVDLNGAAPVVSPTAPVSADRQFSNATVLANGQVWVNGGSTTGNDLVGAVYNSETWNPATGTWTIGATATKPRLYHSISMLMPDGSVLTGGGGAPGPVANMNAEIYYPPYLYKTDGSGQPAERPVIATAPTAAAWGQTIDLSMANKKNISRMTLVRFGAVTHAFSNEQRFQDVAFTQNGKGVKVTLPASAHNAPPGYYMLFAVGVKGVPSIAKVLRLGS